MDPLKIEAYFFSNNIKHPEPGNIPELIALFSDYELMPQYFEENNVVNGTRTKRFCFTNPVTNKSVHFYSDKIVISESLNPFDLSDVDRENLFQKFNDYLSYSISVCEKFSGGDLRSNRLSLIYNFVIGIDGSTSSSNLAQELGDTLPWISGPLTEVKLRTGEDYKSDLINEDINIVVSANDGVVEKGNGQYTEKKACFLIHVDVNTKPNNRESRFDVDLAKRVWVELSEISDQKASAVNAYLEK